MPWWPLAVVGLAALAGAGEPTGPVVIKAGTEVLVELAEPVGSATATAGMMVPIRLVSPLVVDGAERLPAGAAGEARVLHAAKRRTGGKPGELLLSARWIEHAGLRVPLRGFRAPATGKDNIEAANVAIFVAGLPGLIVRGGDVLLPEGTRATAQVATDTPLPEPPPAEPPPAEPPPADPPPS